MAVNAERGGAIIFLFIAVALFGALSYAFLQGSRSSTTMITSEADKAAAYKSQDCTNAVNMATKRLQTRGCTATQISSDSTGAVGTGPTDGSCAIFHPNGGSVKATCGAPPVPTDPCTTGAIGTVCTSDGAIYIGDVAASRIYAASADEGGSPQWKTTSSVTPGTTSMTDGRANTLAMIAAGPTDHPAGNACANKAPLGTWYLPAKDELNLVWTNRVAIDLAANGFDTTAFGYYWSSTEDWTNAWIQRPSDGDLRRNAKAQNFFLRCVRQ